tara:strand:+ start:1525 stop:1926 length:402 start_codon:yes stop_codon:yes gene_type:complete
MKVKMTKTIDINQIPVEVRRMLDQAKNVLVYGLSENMNQVVAHSLSSQGEVFFHTLELIDSFRQDLASLDESLQEAHNIIRGYKEAVMPETETHQEQDVVTFTAEEYAEQEQAEYEKSMSQMDGADEVEDEEG